MFWKIKSKEYLELKRKLLEIELDVEQLQQRWKKKIKPKKDEEDETPSTFNDGFDDLRKLNKESDSYL